MKARGARRTGALVVVLGLIAAGCSGAASAETIEFCESFVAADALVSNGPDSDVEAWAGEVVTSLTGLEEIAPAEVENQVGVITGTILPAVEAGDEEALFSGTESEAFLAASTAIDEYLKGECGWDVLSVKAVDYAYEADFDGLEPGYVGLEFENSGTEIHEMVVVRINDDTTETVEKLLELPEEEALSKVSFIGVAFGEPGSSDTLYADLDAGRYAVFCFLPVGSTSMEALEAGEVDGPPHFTQGMITEFTIEG